MSYLIKISAFLSIFMYLPSVLAAETKALSVNIVENGHVNQPISAFISSDASKAFLDFGHQNGITFLLDFAVKQSHRLDHNAERISTEALPEGTQAVKLTMLTMSPTGEHKLIAGYETQRFTLKVGVIDCGSAYISDAKAIAGLAPLFVQYGKFKAHTNSSNKDICRYAEELAFISAPKHGIPLKYTHNNKTLYEVLRAGDDLPADSRMFALPPSYKTVDVTESIASAFPHRDIQIKTTPLAGKEQDRRRISPKASNTVKVKSKQKHTTAKLAATQSSKNKLNIHDIDALSKRLENNTNELFSVLTFASWCAPCRNSLQAMLELNERYAKFGLTLHVVVVQPEKDFAKYLQDSQLRETLNGGKSYVNFYIDSDDTWSKRYSPKKQRVIPELIFPNTSQELKVLKGFRDSKPYQKRIKSVMKEMANNEK